MGALISLFIQLVVTMVSVTLSLLMTAINLTASLVTQGARRRSTPRPVIRSNRGGSRQQGSKRTGTIVVVLFVALLIDPRLAILLGVVLAVVWWVRRRSVRYRTPTAQELAQALQNVRSMSGPQFEVFVTNVFRAMGHKAQILGGSGDQGVDILLTANGQRIAVQCKNYAKPVGNKPVQEVYAGAKHHKCQSAWVVAPSGYTRGAFELARSVGVSLFDTNSIRAWIKEVDKVSNSGDKVASGGVEAKEQKAYDTILDAYEGYLGILEELYQMKRSGEVPPTPADQEKWNTTLSQTYESIEQASATLDTLEARNPGWATEERVERRAQLASRQLRLSSTGPQASVDIPDQIRKLAELRDSGALTNEEFEGKKRDLLDRM